MDKFKISIEIGERITKICLLSKKSNIINVVKSVYFPTPDQSISDGNITQPDLLAKVISDKLIEHKIRETNNVVFTLMSSKIVSRKVFLPPVKERQLKSLVQANAADYFPIDLTNYQVTYTIVEKMTGKKPGNQVLVMAVPKQLMMGYGKLAEIANLQIINFDYTLNAQYQLFKRLNISGVTLYLSIDTKQSIATFTSGSSMLFQRIIPFGGDELINKIMYSTNSEEDNVPNIIEQCKSAEFMARMFTKENFEMCVERLTSGLTRTADMFNTTFKSFDIERIVLIDTCAEFAGIKQAVYGALDINTYTLNELAESAKVITGNNFVFNATCASGMSEPLNIDVQSALSLSKGKKENKSVTAVSARSAVLLMVFCILAGTILSIIGITHVVGVQNDIDTAQARIIELSEIENAYNVYIEYNAIKQNFEIVENLAYNNNAGITAFLEELEVKMPSNLVLLSATCDNYGVTINVQTSTMGEAAYVLSQLRTFESIVTISTSGLTEAQNEIGTTTTSFTVMCAYTDPDSEQTADLGDLENAESFDEVYEEDVEEMAQ